MLRPVKSMHFYDHELKNFSNHVALLRESTLFTSFLSTGQLQCGEQITSFHCHLEDSGRHSSMNISGAFIADSGFLDCFRNSFPGDSRSCNGCFFSFFEVFYSFSPFHFFPTRNKHSQRVACVRALTCPGSSSDLARNHFFLFFLPFAAQFQVNRNGNDNGK